MGLWCGGFRNLRVAEGKKKAIKIYLENRFGRILINLQGEFDWSSLDRCK
jgi:hypothetical protein